MKKARLFTLLFCLAAGLFLVGNYVIWNVWVADLRSATGEDLARMGYLSGVTALRSHRNDLPVRYLDYSAYRGEGVDVLTLGDSFSNNGGLGVNGRYQDHLATHNDFRVLNLKGPGEDGDNPQSLLIKLFNSGELDRVKPRYVLLQSVERYAVRRLGRELDFTLTASPEELAVYIGNKADANASPGSPAKTEGKEERGAAVKRLLGFITSANAKFLLNRLSYRFTDHNIDKTVYAARLRQNFFNVPEGDLLIYYFEDTRHIKAATPEAMSKLNDNLNILAQMLETKGIRLIFMPVVDKYNLYRDYLVNDAMPRSQFFERLRPLKKNYLFIDTKVLLSEELAKGEKDIFFADDTHWSGKAGAAIFSSFALP